MCTATAGMAIQGVSSIFGAVAARNQQDAMSSYYNYQAQIVKNQATLSANNIQQNAGMQIAQVADQGRQVLGAQKVALGANGISSDSFSYQQVQDTTVAQNKLDQMAVAYNADTKAWGVMHNANIEATNDEAASQNAKISGDLAFGAGLLNGAAQFSDTWAKWQQTSQGKTTGNSSSAITMPQIPDPYTNNFKQDAANALLPDTINDFTKWQSTWGAQYGKRSIFGG